METRRHTSVFNNKRKTQVLMKRGTAKEQERKEACERTEKDAKQVQFLNLSLSRQLQPMSNVGVVESPMLKVKHAHDRLIKSLRAC